MNLKIEHPDGLGVLLFNVPSRIGKSSVELPAGLLYAGSAIKRAGYRVKIIDLYLHDFSGINAGERKIDFINNAINEFDPCIVGFGGIATSYGRTKRLSSYISEFYPKVTQIAGGALSSVSDLLLRNTNIDFIFHGEAETGLIRFLDNLRSASSVSDVPGISYKENGKIVINPPGEQIKDLDSVPFPDYSLIELNRYLRSMDRWLDEYRIILRDNPHSSGIIEKVKSKMCMPVFSSRGCTNSCSFCYRHLTGHRQHSVRYVIEHMKRLQADFGLEGFQFCDELFNAHTEWVREFCATLKNELPGIFYMIGGARVDRMDEDLLERLKETGCVEIGYGHESGSDAILKEYRKGTTSGQNADITNLSVKKGIISPVQLVIGSPGENRSTIGETINFLKSVNAYIYSLNYLIPLPKAPVWRLVEERKLVDDTEKYLDLVADSGGIPLVNLTAQSDKEWKSWGLLIRKEMRLYYYLKKKRRFYFFYKILVESAAKVIPVIPGRLKQIIPAWIKKRC